MGADRETDVQIRCPLRADLPELMEIENQSFEFPWAKQVFLAAYRLRKVEILVAEHSPADCVVGYLIVQKNAQRIMVDNLAVARDWRRQGIGAALIARASKKFIRRARRRIVAVVRESNLVAQFFFRAQGFKAIKIVDEYYDGEPLEDEQAYLMEWMKPTTRRLRRRKQT